MKRIIIDVDGILADFTAGFCAKLTEHGATLRPFEDPAGPTLWEWEIAYGASANQREAAWRDVNASPGWWWKLRPHPDAAGTRELIAYLGEKGHEVIFCSHRPITCTALAQWLEYHDFTEAGDGATAITVHGDKVPALISLRGDVVIEDRRKTLEDWLTSPLCHASAQGYLVDRPYNRSDALPVPGMRIFKSTAAALREVLR